MARPLSHEADMEALKRAVPYLKLFHDKIFVIKVGGEAAGDDGRSSVAEQVRVLWELGIRVVLVHGGGPQTTEVCERLGVQSTFVGGRRVTDAATLDATVMTLNGLVNTAWVAAFRGLGVPAVGVSGVDGGLIRARRRPPTRVDGATEEVDFGFVGDIEEVDPSLLQSLLVGGFLPVVSPLTASRDGAVLNVNADTVAAALAVALHAEKMILVTGVPGLLEDAGDRTSLVSYVDLDGVQKLKERGVVSGGMLPKVRAAEEALRGGVRRVHIIGWREPSSLLIEVFTNDGAGTLIVRDLKDLAPAEQGSASPG